MLERFPREEIILHKMNGEIIENIEALIGKKIMIEDTDVIIEEGDFFERLLPNGLKEFYYIKDKGFIVGIGGIPDHYEVSFEKVSSADMERCLAKCKNMGQEEVQMEQRQNKLFISHSSKDQNYMMAFVELIESLQMPEGVMVCTSVPGYGIPGDNTIYEWLREQFVTCDLRVIYALSDNYYGSPVCLNEMGAAWVTKSAYTLMLLPGFQYSDIKGCIDDTKIGISLGGDEEELRHRLNELKDILIEEYNLSSITETKWERYRTNFINRVNEIFVEQSQKDNLQETDSVTSESKSKIPDQITYDMAILLVYAAAGDGKISFPQYVSGTSLIVGGESFMENESPREIARWNEAIVKLREMRFIQREKKSRFEEFIMTHSGYEMADLAKQELDIETSKDPIEYLNRGN